MRICSIVVDGCMRRLNADIPQDVVEALDHEQEETEEDNDGAADQEDDDLKK